MQRTTKKPKRHFYIIRDGKHVGDTWAVSPEKARVNFWWKYVKYGNPYTISEQSPEDFDVVEAI